MGIETVLKVLANLLRDLAARIDAGNSNLTEQEAIELVSVIGHYTNREEYISKYEACKYLNISRATFDNYVKEGKLPKGKERISFKELAWTKKDLDEAVKKLKAKSR